MAARPAPETEVTVPPRPSTSAISPAKASPTTWRRSSGSNLPPMPTGPESSANRTLTSLRSSLSAWRGTGRPLLARPERGASSTVASWACLNAGDTRNPKAARAERQRS